MKATFKNIAVALSILAMVMVVLAAVDKASSVTALNGKTYIKVTVVDTDGKPVHNAQVSVCGATFLTDNKGVSPSIEIAELNNRYDVSVTDWVTNDVIIKCDGFVPAIVFNCVSYAGQTRKLTVKIYPKDSSDLPYVSYVESPPDEYAKTLLNN